MSDVVEDMSGEVPPVPERGQWADLTRLFISEEYGNLLMEFLDTLINDTPSVKAMKLWALVSTSVPAMDGVAAAVAQTFINSKSSEDLQMKWEDLLDRHWDNYLDCALKLVIRELEKGY